jgi:hypothetical protein
MLASQGKLHYKSIIDAMCKDWIMSNVPLNAIVDMNKDTLLERLFVEDHPLPKGRWTNSMKFASHMEGCS